MRLQEWSFFRMQLRFVAVVDDSILMLLINGQYCIHFYQDAK